MIWKKFINLITMSKPIVVSDESIISYRLAKKVQYIVDCQAYNDGSIFDRPDGSSYKIINNKSKRCTICKQNSGLYVTTYVRTYKDRCGRRLYWLDTKWVCIECSKTVINRDVSQFKWQSNWDTSVNIVTKSFFNFPEHIETLLRLIYLTDPTWNQLPKCIFGLLLQYIVLVYDEGFEEDF
jgi:hypothetical protein